MKLQEALRLLDIVTDVNGQYSKEERMHAAMRLEELLRHSKNHISKVIAGVLIVLLLFILLF